MMAIKYMIHRPHFVTVHFLPTGYRLDSSWILASTSLTEPRVRRHRVFGACGVLSALVCRSLFFDPSALVVLYSGSAEDSHRCSRLWSSPYLSRSTDRARRSRHYRGSSRSNIQLKCEVTRDCYEDKVGREIWGGYLWVAGDEGGFDGRECPVRAIEKRGVERESSTWGMGCGYGVWGEG